MTTDGELAVRALYEQLMTGWNNGSGQSFAAPFSLDADFVPFDGQHLTGRQALAESLEPLFKTHLRGTRLTGEVVRVRFLSPTVAVMLARGQTTLRGRRTPAPERDSWQTLVAVKGERGWELEAFQNTRVRPIGQHVVGTLLWLVGDLLWRLVPRR